MPIATTQAELDAINAAVAASGAVRVKKATKVAIAAFEGGEFTTDTARAWMAAQLIKQPELFKPKPEKVSTNPWSSRFPADKKNGAIADYIRKFGTASASRMAASKDVDIAGRPLRARA